MNIWRFVQLVARSNENNRERAREGKPMELTPSEKETLKKILQPKEDVKEKRGEG